MNRKLRKAKLAEWQERRDRNREQPLDEFIVMDAIVRGYIDRAKQRIRKTDGMLRVDLDLPAEVMEWLDREALAQGVTVEQLVRRLIAASRAYDATRA